MSSRRKIVLAALAAASLLALLGIAAAKLMLSDEHLAAIARDRVQTSLGRDLTLGQLSLRFRPLPTVVFKDARLGNASWAKEAYFLHAEHATARLDLAALVRGRLEVAALTIDGLTANLEATDDGRKNWQLPSSQGRRGDKPAVPMHLGSLQIKDARIRYYRHGAPVKNWLLDEVIVDVGRNWRNVKLDATLVQNAIPLQIKGRFADLSRIGQEGAVSDGDVELSLGSARLMVSGALPVSGSLQKHHLKLDFRARSAKEALGFFGIADIDLAPIEFSVDLRDSENRIHADKLRFQIGRLHVIGTAEIAPWGEQLRYRADLASEELNWAQTMSDIGRPPLPPQAPGDFFRDTPLGWRAIAAMQAVPGNIDLRIHRLILRSGIELENLKASIVTSQKQWRAEQFSFAMLDGTASGALILDGHKRTAKLSLEASKVSLGKWLAARGHKLALTGGPTDLNAALSASGLSMRDLAASLNGQVRISVGPAKLHSRQIQQAETWLIGLAPMFSARQSDYVNVACMSAYLPFKNGRAVAEPIGGVRSDASQLLASGYVDLNDNTLDLRGRVRARSGVSLGISSIAGGNLKIAGGLHKPSIGLDPESTPGTLARIGAAIMTSGASLLATAIWDAANPSSDPCQITFNAHDKRKTAEAKKATLSRNAETESAAR